MITTKTATLYSVAFLVVIVIFIGIIISSVTVTGASNQTMFVKVNITNTEPVLYSVSITPSSIDLNPGNITIVNCTGLIQDYNGWSDIDEVNATIYHIDYGDGIAFDNNYRYQNSSCNSSCQMYGGDPNNATCTCQFAVEYYAFNGSWQCNMTIADSFGLSDTENSSTANLNTVVGIGVPAELDYGNMSVTETSPMKPVNISNLGNIMINVSVRSYAGTDEFAPLAGNFTMFCQTNNISYGYQKFTTNATEVFANMWNATNSSTGIPNFDLPGRTDDLALGNDTNTTYWQLEIPSDVSGFCNGSIVFQAYQAN